MLLESNSSVPNDMSLIVNFNEVTHQIKWNRVLNVTIVNFPDVG